MRNWELLPFLIIATALCVPASATEYLAQPQGLSLGVSNLDVPRRFAVEAPAAAPSSSTTLGSVPVLAATPTPAQTVANLASVSVSLNEKIAPPMSSKGKAITVTLASLGGRSFNPTVVLDCKKNGDFITFSALLKFFTANENTYANQRVIVFVAACTYKEKVRVQSTSIRFLFAGAGTGSTTVVWSDTASTVGNLPNGQKGPLGTFNSYTFATEADYTLFEGITFQNAAPEQAVGSNGLQAVAVRASSNFVAFFNCAHKAFQDTLYSHQGIHYFLNNYIEGTVDFIFGDGQARFENCDINNIRSSTVAGSVAAQKRASASSPTGFVFINCNVRGVPGSSSILSRTWGQYSRVVFALCTLAQVANPGYTTFGPGTEGFNATAFYAEYQNKGPSALSTPRVPWSLVLTAAQAQPFLSLNFIQGSSWLTGGGAPVPPTPGTPNVPKPPKTKKPKPPPKAPKKKKSPPPPPPKKKKSKSPKPPPPKKKF